jgi:hypothetical protein
VTSESDMKISMIMGDAEFVQRHFSKKHIEYLKAVYQIVMASHECSGPLALGKRTSQLEETKSHHVALFKVSVKLSTPIFN